jgi:lincosamide and streptogramin A transport system ATP-binding/permease protein
MALKNSINRLNKSFVEKKAWSDNKEADKLFAPKTKVSADDRLKKGDKGRIGAKSAKMMKRAKNIENRILKIINEKKELVNFIEKDYEIKFKEYKKEKKKYLGLIN